MGLEGSWSQRFCMPCAGQPKESSESLGLDAMRNGRPSSLDVVRATARSVSGCGLELAPKDQLLNQLSRLCPAPQRR